MEHANPPETTPTLEEQVRECRRLLAEFDNVPWPEMGTLFYQQAYEELRINLGLLLDVVESESRLGGEVNGA